MCSPACDEVDRWRRSFRGGGHLGRRGNKIDSAPSNSMALQIPSGGSSLFKQGYTMHSGIEESIIRYVPSPSVPAHPPATSTPSQSSQRSCAPPLARTDGTRWSSIISTSSSSPQTRPPSSGSSRSCTPPARCSSWPPSSRSTRLENDSLSRAPLTAC